MAATAVTHTGRLVRSIVAAVVVVGAVAATLVGSDDWFPFTPMRQYAYAVDPNGRTSTHFLEGIGPAGEPVTITFDDIELRPSELEGLLSDVSARPRLLARLLDTYRANRIDAPPTVGIRYLRTVVQLEDRRPLPPRIIELGRYLEDR